MLSLQGDLGKMVTNYLSNTSQMHLIFLKLFLWWVIKRIMTTSSIWHVMVIRWEALCVMRNKMEAYIGCASELHCIILHFSFCYRLWYQFTCPWSAFDFFFCCSSGPIVQQGSLNFNLIKSKNHVSWSWTFSGKPLNLLWYILCKLFRVLMSFNFWTHVVFL